MGAEATTEVVRFGWLLRHLREDREMTREQLASIAGVEPSTIWRMESGSRNPSVKMLDVLTEALGLGPAEAGVLRCTAFGMSRDEAGSAWAYWPQVVLSAWSGDDDRL